MSDFITMVNRITTELRRSNLTTEAKAAVNDAIREAAKTRFWFNEVRTFSFPTVADQEYYDDVDATVIDSMWFLQGASRENIYPVNNDTLNEFVQGANPSQRPELFSRVGTSIRLYPIPNTVLTIYVEGGGSKLTPYPLVTDNATNAWMTHGELYIRALAKRNLLRDVINDLAQAQVMDAVAQDYKDDLMSETSERIGTGCLQPTQF